MSAVDADFCNRGGRIPRYRFREPLGDVDVIWKIYSIAETSERSCLKAERADIP